MGKVISKIDLLLERINQFIIVLTGSAVAILIMVGAFMRYVIKMDFYGSEEIILMVGFWLFFVGSISAAREKSHLNANMVAVFTNNPMILKISDLLRDVLSLAVCSLAIYWCYDYWSWVFPLQPKTSVHKIPYYIQQFPMCISFLLWGFYLIRDSYFSVKAVVKSKDSDTKGVIIG
ncbi:hypothetical protein MASR2M70_21010 [Bacillota bacterium]